MGEPAPKVQSSRTRGGRVPLYAAIRRETDKALRDLSDQTGDSLSGTVNRILAEHVGTLP